MFPKKTVDSVMTAFTKTIADLKAVQEQNCDDADRHAAEAAEANAKQRACLGEAVRAGRLLGKLEELVK